MSEPVIRVEGLSKRYRLGTFGYGSLQKDVQSFIARLRGKEDPNRPLHVAGASSQADRHGAGGEFWALRDVSFEVPQGEVLGVIGGNGAGKSTLLKILSRITAPTSGRVELRGRVASMLEVGTGFHPELTGRENVYLNGAILGMSRDEIERKFDEIVAFSGVEEFIDTPVKRYSSGMYVRLAFAVAAHLEPEILLVDEVLAVGDAEFQKKCLGKMGDVAKGGRTVLFVSHNMAAVKTLCGDVLWINGGRVHALGKSNQVIDEYVRTAYEQQHDCDSIADRPRPPVCTLDVKIIDFEVIVDGERNPASWDSLATVLVRLKVRSSRDGLRTSAEITVENGQQPLVYLNSGVQHSAIFRLDEGEHWIECAMKGLNLYAGDYYFNFVLSLPRQQLIDRVENAFKFTLSRCDPYHTGENLTVKSGHGLFHVDHAWTLVE